MGKGGDVLGCFMFALFCFVLRVASLIIVKATLCRGGIDGLSSQIKGELVYSLVSFFGRNVGRDIS